MITLMNLPIRRGNAPLRIARGHFATNHSHINYFVDITYQKTRLSEAKDSAHQLVSHFINDTPVDTILCLDGTAVLGTCLAEELTKSGFQTINAHQTIYVLEPEYNANSQIIFRDNTRKMITGKHVLVLMASVTTGFTAKRSLEAIGYYGGHVAIYLGGGRIVHASTAKTGIKTGTATYAASAPSTTCPATRATTTGTAPTARPVRSWTLWSTASAIPRCNGGGDNIMT